MHTTRLWAMAHLTCYHCHITCVSRITNSNLYRWSRPRTMPVVAGVAFNATTSDRILLNPFRSKCALKPCGTRAGGQFESQSYPLSINTRIAREICSNFELFFLVPPKPHIPPTYTHLIHRLSPRICEQQKPPHRWLASLRDTNHHPQYLPRAVVNHKIGTHAGGAGPRDFLFDEFGNGERYAEFFRVP